MANSNTLPLSLMLLRVMYNSLGPLMPSMFGRMAYNSWFSTTRFKTPERELAVTASAKEEIVQMDGLDVTSYRWGDAASPTVLFIHGWSGRGTQACAFVEPILQAGFSLLSFDAPAHGRTAGKQTSVLQFVDTLLALDGRHGPFHGCITHSVGGMALALACRFGFTVQRAVCICPPNDFDTILRNFSRILSLPESVQQAMLNRLYATHGSIIRQIVSVEHNAETINFPTLLIHDRDDPEIPWQNSEKIHRAWRGSSLMLTDGLKHHRIVRDDTVVRAAVDFLQHQ